MLDRRTAIAGIGVGVCAAAAGAGLLAATEPNGKDSTPEKPLGPDAGLREHAARRGMSFGTEVIASEIASDRALAAAILHEADMVVPGIEMKWGENERQRGRPRYEAAEQIVAFAEKNGLRVRGHTAFWYKNVPPWAAPILATPDATALLLKRVQDVVGHFKGRVFEWDVVNEAIEPRDKLAGGMRAAPFGRSMDAGYIADAFQAAHTADPAARLYYNEYSLEYDMDFEEDRRNAVLALLTELKRRNAPVHGLGLQTHLRVERPFSARKYRAFLANAAALGLEMRITEFDVLDDKAPTDIAARDQMVASHGAMILNAAFDERAMKGMLGWGLSDRTSWMRKAPGFARPDGQLVRTMPLDDQLQRKPLWHAIAAAFDAAPAR
jgi:endo-1,4-beta-xylanase